jgi:hypothetical protein
MNGTSIDCAISPTDTTSRRNVRVDGRDFLGVDQPQKNTLMEQVVNLINATVEADPTTSSGLSPLAEACTTNAVGAIIKELSRKLGQNEIDMNYLWDVFSAGYGAGIVGEVMFAPIMRKLRNTV